MLAAGMSGRAGRVPRRGSPQMDVRMLVCSDHPMNVTMGMGDTQVVRRRSRPVGLLEVCSVVLVVACGSDDDGGPKQTVHDQAGRTCVLETAGKVTCDQEPKPTNACKTGTTACFQLGTTGDVAGPGAICAACCGTSSSTSFSMDCVNLTCASAADCPPEYGRCVSGACRY